jgi:hypothetical protein
MLRGNRGDQLPLRLLLDGAEWLEIGDANHRRQGIGAPSGSRVPRRVNNGQTRSGTNQVEGPCSRAPTRHDPSGRLEEQRVVRDEEIDALRLLDYLRRYLVANAELLDGGLRIPELETIGIPDGGSITQSGKGVENIFDKHCCRWYRAVSGGRWWRS